MQNRNTDSDSTLKGPITSDNTLSSFSSACLCHSWFWSLCDLGQCANIAYIIKFPHCLWCILDHIRLIHMTQSSAQLLHCLVSRSWNSSWILERCRVSKTNYFLVFVLNEFPSGVSCSYFLSQMWSYVPTSCNLRLIKGLKISPAHTKHFWVRIGISILRVCWSSHSLCPSLWNPLRWEFWPLIERLQKRIDVRHYVICTTNVHQNACCLPLGKSCPVFLVWWSQCWTHCHWLKFASMSLSPACPV